MYISTDITDNFEGISYVKLRNWRREGFIFPSVPAKKKGAPAEYSFYDVCLIVLFRDLLDRGVNRNAVKNFLHYFLKLDNEGIPMGASEELLEQTNFIIARYEKDQNGKEVVKFMLVPNIDPEFRKDARLDFWEGTVLSKNFAENLDGYMHPNRNYRAIYVFNFSQIKREVREKLR